MELHWPAESLTDRFQLDFAAAMETQDPLELARLVGRMELVAELFSEQFGEAMAEENKLPGYVAIVRTRMADLIGNF